MASVSNDPNGRRRVLFTRSGKRQAIRLGKVSERAAETVCRHVENILAAELSRLPLDLETARWLGQVGDELAAKLAAVGLMPKRAASTLGPFLDAYVASRTDLKPRTTENLTICAARLTEFFGADKALRDITARDAERWFLWMKEPGQKGKREIQYADGTVGRTVKRAQQFFAAAVRDRLLTENPFARLKPPSDANEARKAYIDRPTAARLLEACPGPEWRLIVALSRFGGLRCPSETLAVEWSDIDWARERFTVRSPKTGTRTVPIFPDLRPHLESAFEAAADGACHVIAGYRDAGQNLRTQMLRIIRKAGVDPYPKVFHNLRASCETDLMQHFPVHVVCSWIGHKALIAQKHYLTVTEADFRQAAQNAAQHGAEMVRTASQQNEKPQQMLGFAMACEAVRSEKLPDKGANHVNPDQCQSGFSPRGGAESGALAELTALWPTIPPETQAEIMRLARGCP